MTMFRMSVAVPPSTDRSVGFGAFGASRWVAAAGLLVVLAGIFIAPSRVWPNVLLVSVYFVGLGLAGILFLAFHYLLTAGWSVCIKRTAEAVASTIPIGALLVVFTLFGAGVLYEWTHTAAVEADPLLSQKTGWLNLPFFVVRTLIYFGVWILFSHLLVRHSRRQDSTGGLAAQRRNTALSAAFIALFFVTFSLASFDWLMSLEPHWYSTMFAVHQFAGLFVAGLSVMTITVILLKRRGALAGILTEHHLHDLGKLLLGFTTFWMYIWFCQYMLIWYSNLPEEVGFYENRVQGSWGVLTIVSLLANWLIPFLVLLPRPTKHHENTLLIICTLLLLGHWLDLFLIIQPVFEPSAPRFGLWEIAPVAAGVALFVIVLRRGLAAADPVPQKDPYLEESLRHHQ